MEICPPRQSTEHQLRREWRTGRSLFSSRGRCLVYKGYIQLFYTPRVFQGAFGHEKGRLKSDRIINHREQPKHPAITDRKQVYNGKLKVKR